MNGMMLTGLFLAGERVNARQAGPPGFLVIKINKLIIIRGSTCNIAVPGSFVYKKLCTVDRGLSINNDPLTMM